MMFYTILRPLAIAPVLLLCSPAFAVDCMALYRYRDHDLVGAWDRAVQQLRVRTQVTLDLQKLRADLEDTRLRHTGDVALFRNTLLGVVGSVARLISGLLKLNPETGAPAAAIEAGAGTMEHLLERIEAGEDIHALVNEDFGMAALKIALSKGDPAEKAFGVILTLKDDIKDLSELGEKSEKLRDTLDTQIKSINTHLLRYDAEMAKYRRDITYINNVKAAIDRTCAAAIAGHWSGTGGAGAATFPPSGCNFRTSMRVQNFDINISTTGNVTSATLTAVHDEKRITCGTGGIGLQTHNFRLISGHVAGNKLETNFDGLTNKPADMATFAGTISGSVSSGTLTFWRHDNLPPSFEWKITLSQSLHKS